MTVVVGPAAEADLNEVDRVFRISFGTYEKLENPLDAFGDRDMIISRWKSGTSTVLAAKEDGRVIGTDSVSHWGSVGFFGRMAVLPECQGKGVAKLLMEETMSLFTEWRVSYAQTDTWPDSPMHIHLYRKYDFWPKYLTSLMGKKVEAPSTEGAALVSELDDVGARELVEGARKITDGIYPGLDLSKEIEAVRKHQLGDTIFLGETSDPRGFAVCHIGAGTEAGGDSCYIKFGAIRKPGNQQEFEDLLAGCEGLAAKRGAKRIGGGMNTARREAYLAMLRHGFVDRATFIGLHLRDQPGYNSPGTFVVDRWS